MELSFINKEITEARMFRNRTFTRKLNIEDVANFAFLNTLLLFIVYSEYDTGLAGVDYSERTIRYNSFDHYRVSGSDLYLAYYMLFNVDGHADDYIGGTPEKNAMARKRITMPVHMLRKFFKEMATDTLRVDNAMIPRFFLMLEKKLNIKSNDR